MVLETKVFIYLFLILSILNQWNNILFSFFLRVTANLFQYCSHINLTLIIHTTKLPELFCMLALYDISLTQNLNRIPNICSIYLSPKFNILNFISEKIRKLYIIHKIFRTYNF